MTPTGFMTDAAFDELAPSLAKGIRDMPVIRDHPEWTVLLTGDGFHAHKMTLVAQQLLAASKIIFVIEEGDSSQCNQAFDRQVAKHGKSLMRAALDIVSRHNVYQNHIDQYGLLLISLSGIRELIEDPEVVRNSFRSVNMLFSRRVGLDAWLIKIKDFLVRGSKFQDEGVITPRMLLPDWYTQWPADRKQGALKIVSEGDGWSDLDMLKELRSFTGMSAKELMGYQTCWFVETADPNAVADQSPAPARVVTYNPNSTLSSFSLKPPGMKGEELLKHMIKFRKRHTEPLNRVYDTRHADHLDLAIANRVECHHQSGRHVEVSDQLKAIMPSEADLTEGAIMREVGTRTASVMMPKRLLNALGEINAYCTVANDPDRIKRLQRVAELAASIDAMKRFEAEASKAKAADNMESSKSYAPAGIEKLRKDETEVWLFCIPRTTLSYPTPHC